MSVYGSNPCSQSLCGPQHTLGDIAGTIKELGKEQATASAIHQKLSPVIEIQQTEDVATTINDTEGYDKILVGVG